MDALIDTLPCGYVSFADDGRVLATNATLRALLGYAPGEIEGQHIETLLGVAGRIFFQTHLFPMLRLHGAAQEIFLLLRRKDGGEVGALLNAVRREREGRAMNDCVLLEVRERRKYEDELLRARRAAEQANRAKSRFLATMSHELRTPLNAIGGYVQLLEMEIHGPITDAQRDALGRVLRSQQHLLRLINEVLSLARIEAGRVEYTIEDLSLADVVAGVMPMLEPQIAAKRLAFSVSVADGLVARGDRDKVQQILINLLTNAVKFTPAGGRVALDALRDESGRRALVRVSDSGIGIGPDERERIFEPYVRAEAGERARVEGTGLGLAISRELARGMGGDLAVESALGSGSTFTLVLSAA